MGGPERNLFCHRVRYWQLLRLLRQFLHLQQGIGNPGYTCIGLRGPQQYNQSTRTAFCRACLYKGQHFIFLYQPAVDAAFEHRHAPG